MSTISTHVLDTSIGRPAPGITVALFAYSPDGSRRTIVSGCTDIDGRIASLAPKNGSIEAGVYTARFDLEPYFSARGVEGFYPYAEITFHITEQSHYHVPLLVSPFGYSTYRGS